MENLHLFGVAIGLGLIVIGAGLASVGLLPQQQKQSPASRVPLLRLPVL